MCGQASALGGGGLMEDIAHLLGAVVGDFDTDMRLICCEGPRGGVPFDVG